jgi:hypothetical protein
MTHLSAILLSAAGFAFFCLSMPRHKRVLAAFSLTPPPWLPLRWLGAVTLACALLLDMALLGAVQGAVSWFAHLMLGAGAVAATLYKLTEMSRTQPSNVRKR